MWREKAFRVSAFLAAALGFLGILLEPIRGAVPETDLWWMIPVLSQYVTQTAPKELFAFLVSPLPRYFEAPVLKSYLWLVEEGLRLPFHSLVLGAVLVHCLNALLVGWVSHRLGLSRRVALFATLIFLGLFIHHQAFLWPAAFQHLFSVTTILATVGLFLKTEERWAAGKRAQGLYALAWGAALLASLQNAAMIGPVLIGFHVFFCSPDRDTATVRYQRWLPVWVCCMVYPIFSVSFLGLDVILKAVAAHPLPPWTKAASLFFGGVAALLLMGRLIPVLYGSARQRKAIRWVMGSAVLCGAGWLVFRDKRQVLLLYNVCVPLASVLSSFLDPFRTALGIPAGESYYYTPPQLSPVSLIGAIFLVAVFSGKFIAQRWERVLLFVWYLLCLGYLLLHHHVASAMPFQIPSRYFVYITPVFSILAAAVACYAADRFSQTLPNGRRVANGVLSIVLIALMVPNLLAIRVALFRGRLTNTYLVYDDLRLARLIREDWARSGGASAAPGNLTVENAVPTLFLKMQWSRPVDCNRIGHEHLRRFLGEVFQDRSMRAVRINEGPPLSPGARVYRIEGDRILEGQGRSIEPFSELLREALLRMSEEKHESARDLFKKAALERPFLLNYVLARHLRLADLFWVTGGQDFRDLFEHIRGRTRIWGVAPVEKVKRTAELIEAELSNYVLCLLCLSYLEHETGHVEESRFWLSQIWFVEREPEVLIRWLDRIPEVRSSPFLRAFLEKVRDPLFFREPLVWKKEDYAFGRFLVRLVFHWDIRSRWDNRSGVVL